MRCFSFDKLPDLTMAKYSTQACGSVDELVRQHLHFYRQLHSVGMLFGEAYTLLYSFDPELQLGRRMKVYLIVHDGQEASPDQVITSTQIAGYFPLRPCGIPQLPRLKYAATLCKRDSFLSTLVSNGNGYYVVDTWKVNEDARMIGLFRLMKELNEKCIYMISFRPCDLNKTLGAELSKTMRWIRGSGGLQRSESDDRCIKMYNDCIDNLRTSPHFTVRICAYSDKESIARLLVDAVGSEALEEGAYDVISEPSRYDPLELNYRMLGQFVGSNNVPQGFRDWRSAFLLEELPPFAMLPVLYPGEAIEIQKETAPNYEGKDGSILLGVDQFGYSVYFQISMFCKHALIAGVPGSGKTYTMLHLCSELVNYGNHKGSCEIPFLVLEPAKQEYRALARNPLMKDLMVFAPGGSGCFPLRINPFEFPYGMRLSEHITNLCRVFEGAFDMVPPMPKLIDEGIEAVYRDCGWLPFEINEGQHPYPSMTMLYSKVEQLLEGRYDEEIRNRMKSVLQVRIGSLLRREMGNVFDVPKSTFAPEEWMKQRCILELEKLGRDGANFMTLLLMTLIREYLRQNPRPEHMPRHVIFIEEAHNLIGKSTEESPEQGNTKVASTQYVVDMLAEVRALGEGIIIADQLPTSLAPQVTKNTTLKVAHRITATDDREFLGGTMGIDAVQMEQLGQFTKGQALCVYEGVPKPFEVQIHKYEGDDASPDDAELFGIMRERDYYEKLMRKDFKIMFCKFSERRGLLEKNLNSCCNVLQYCRKELDKPDISEAVQQVMLDRQQSECKKMKSIGNSMIELIYELGDYICMNTLMKDTGIELMGKFIDAFSSNLQQMRNCNADIANEIEQRFVASFETIKRRLTKAS